MIHLPKHPVFTQCQAHFRQCRMSFYSTCLVYMHSTVQAGDTFQTLPSSLRDTLQLRRFHFTNQNRKFLEFPTPQNSAHPATTPWLMCARARSFSLFAEQTKESAVLNYSTYISALSTFVWTVLLRLDLEPPNFSHFESMFEFKTIIVS